MSLTRPAGPGWTRPDRDRRRKRRRLGSSASELPLSVAVNPAWQRGQSTSLSVGLRELPAETTAVMFLLADQPLVTPALIDLLIDAFAASAVPSSVRSMANSAACRSCSQLRNGKTP